MQIVSVPDRLVWDPATRRPVDENPITIDPTDVYWARLLADGDVAELVPEPAPSPAPSPKPKTAPAVSDAAQEA